MAESDQPGSPAAGEGGPARSGRPRPTGRSSGTPGGAGRTDARGAAGKPSGAGRSSGGRTGDRSASTGRGDGAGRSAGAARGDGAGKAAGRPPGARRSDGAGKAAGRPPGAGRSDGAGRPAGAGRGADAGKAAGRDGAARGRSDAGSRPDRAERARRTAGRPAALTEEEKAQIAARYDPRREKRRQEARVPLPDDVEAGMLDPEVRRELRSLSKETADLVARHLVMAGRLLDEDPDAALVHARAARALAGRVGAVREAAGLTAYLAGDWADALSELRTARRITGSAEHLPVLADCERALGRPERALAYADDPAVGSLDQATRVELVIVLAGARRDLGQADAAVVTVQDPARRTTAKRPWAARLWYAYADCLLAAGRQDEAREWFSRAADVDLEGETDAADRLLELDGVVLEEPEHEDADEGTDDDPDGRSGAQEATPPS